MVKKIRNVVMVVCVIALAIVFVGCSKEEDSHKHEMGDWIIDVEPTCTTEGSKHIACKECEEVLLTEVIAKMAHESSDWIVTAEANCESNGERFKECVKCKEKLQTETVEKTGHTEGEWIVETEATQKTEGSRYKKCMVCGKEIKRETIPCEATMTSEELAAYVQERTVSVVVNDKTNGTGFFIDDKGTLVTCFHVIDNVFDSSTPSIKIKVFDGAEYSLEHVVKFDPAYDLAVLKIDTKGKSTPYLKIAEKESVTGAKVYACGAALGEVIGNFTNGQISSPSNKYGLSDSYISTAPISKGNSGGPLVNEYGEVIGVNAAAFAQGDNMNVAIKINNIDVLRVTGEKTMSEFAQWHSFETRDAYHIFIMKIVNEATEFTTYYYDSYIHAYHDEIGASCKYSSDTYLATSGINGYDSQKYYYTYSYDKDQYLKYVEYLKGEGYEYDEEFGGDQGGGVFIDYYFNEIDYTYVEFVTYTNRSTGERLIQVNMFVVE